MDDPEAQLQALIDRFDPVVAGLARACRARLQRRFPHALELVFDNYSGLGWGYSTSEKGSGVVVSLVVYPRYVRLFFLRGVGLPDPSARLEGNGAQVRSILLRNAEGLDEPAVGALIDAAEAAHGWPWPEGAGRVLIRSTAKRQQARRPNPETRKR